MWRRTRRAPSGATSARTPAATTHSRYARRRRRTLSARRTRRRPSRSRWRWRVAARDGRPAPPTRARRRTRRPRSAESAPVAPGALATRRPRTEQPAAIEFAHEPEPRVGADRLDVRGERQIPAKVRCHRRDRSRPGGGSPLRERGTRRPRRRRRPEDHPGAQAQGRRLGEERRILEIDRPAVDDPDPPADGRDGAVGVGVGQDPGIGGSSLAIQR